MRRKIRALGNSSGISLPVEALNKLKMAESGTVLNEAEIWLRDYSK
jgi:hypothetical protein